MPDAEDSIAETILIIDDERDIVEYLSLILEEHGYRTLTATDADQGLARALETRPDLITVDIMMPRKSGAALIKEFNDDPGLRNIPILVISAFSKNRDLHSEQFHALLGARIPDENYLEKPIRVPDFIARVQSILETQARAKTLEK